MARTDPRPNYGSGVIYKQGYRYLWRPGHPLASTDGYVAEHRMVVFDAGIEIPSGSHVHHRNHDRGDNRLENLEVMSEREHHAHHMREGARVGNQYGTFLVLSEVDRRATELERHRRRHRRDRAARTAAGLCEAVATHGTGRPCNRPAGHLGRHQATPVAL